MPSQLNMTGAALLRGARADFREVYAKTYETIAPLLSGFVDLQVPSDKIEELYVVNTSAPHPQRISPGQQNQRKPFKSLSFTVPNYEFQVGTSWYWTDPLDDQTGTVLERARSAGQNMADLDERIALQILTGTTDPDLLPAIPTAADGAALFSTTGGDGAARFGVADGNIVTGSGVTDVVAVQQDFYSTVTRMGLFQDTEGQPLHSPSTLREFTIVYNVANDRLFKQAFEQSLIFQNNANTDAAAAPSNFLKDLSYLRYNLIPTQRVTDNDWYVSATNVRSKPIFIQQRMPVTDYTYRMGDGQYTPTTQRVEGVDWLCRKGGGVTVPYGIVKVNN